RVRRFRFFDDLRALMQEEIQSGAYDAIIHSAAVSDYRVAAVYTENEKMIAHSEEQNKIGSNHPSLTIKLVPTEKLIDLIREPWGFSGTLVKFKLQVGLTDEELLKIAERSLRVSAANLIVANCLEWAHEYAYVLDAKGGCERVTRFDLPNALLRRFK
ncbi:MAG TPA: phosphopantothenoylcysteine decarboxylase, partial [Patescibacteria group bacterium]|nr:phosphopantothenoylcysteine decarboxylase [Patescibacteria group bacterium]